MPNLPKCRVRVWKSYRTYQSVGYGYGCCTKLTKVSGTGMDACTRTCTRPLVFQQGRTRYQGILPRAYRTYQSVGYGYECRTELTKGSGTGMDVTKLTKRWGTAIDVVPSLPRGRGMDVLPSLPNGRVWYVCMYGRTYSNSMDRPSKVANPARGQLNRENEYFLSAFAPENLVSRDEFGSPVPRQPDHLHTRVRLLVPISVPDPGYFNKAVPGTRVFYRGRTERTEVSGTGVEVVQAYQSVGYG